MTKNDGFTKMSVESWKSYNTQKLQVFKHTSQRSGPPSKKFCVPDRCYRDSDCEAMKGKNHQITGVYHSMGCKPVDHRHGQCVYQSTYIMPRYTARPAPAVWWLIIIIEISMSHLSRRGSRIVKLNTCFGSIES